MVVVSSLRPRVCVPCPLSDKNLVQRNQVFSFPSMAPGLSPVLSPPRPLKKQGVLCAQGGRR